MINGVPEDSLGLGWFWGTMAVCIVGTMGEGWLLARELRRIRVATAEDEGDSEGTTGSVASVGKILALCSKDWKLILWAFISLTIVRLTALGLVV